MTDISGEDDRKLAELIAALKGTQTATHRLTLLVASTSTTHVFAFPPNSTEAVSDVKCLRVCTWLPLSERSVASWIPSTLEGLEKQLAAFCALRFNVEGGHLRSVIKNRFGGDELMEFTI